MGLLICLKTTDILPVFCSQVAVKRTLLPQQKGEKLPSKQILDATRYQFENFRLKYVYPCICRVRKDNFAFWLFQKASNSSILIHQYNSVFTGIVHQR